MIGRAALLPLVMLTLFPFLSHAQCAQDHRSEKKGGIQIADFTIVGTQALSSSELAQMTGDFTGSCFDEDTDELEERVRAVFQDNGYFRAVVKGVKLKTVDPLAVPKTVTMEADVTEGSQYKLAEINFLKNHAFTAEKLRQQFPLKAGAIFTRNRVASGLTSLRKLYASEGYLDFVCIPDTEFGSNATANLTITIEEGPQYRLDKLEIIAKKESAARLVAEWKLTEGSAYDAGYIDKFIEENRDLLPGGFSRENVAFVFNCPDALVDVTLIADAAEDSAKTPRLPIKNIPCDSSSGKPSK
jgi:outer membrane protein assembly factor BamA